METKKILVTGGAGYIGSILVPELLNEGHEVTVIDNFMYRQSSLNILCRDKKFNVINGDVRDELDLKRLVGKNDVIIPLAALVGAPLCNKDKVGAHTTNYESIIKMLSFLSDEQMVLMPTTNSAYGTGDKNNFCTEDSDLRPISKYAIDKVAVEKILMNRENSISFRLATVFGMSPRMRTDLLVNDFVYRACNDGFIILFEGHFKRNYIHVKDVANAFLFGINNFNKMKANIYNVGLSEANLSKLELCHRIKSHIDSFVFMEAGIGKDPDQRNYIVSNEKIEKAGFIPKYTIDEGIIELIKGYKMIKNNIYGNV